MTITTNDFVSKHSGPRTEYCVINVTKERRSPVGRKRATATAAQRRVSRRPVGVSIIFSACCYDDIYGVLLRRGRKTAFPFLPVFAPRVFDTRGFPPESKIAVYMDFNNNVDNCIIRLSIVFYYDRRPKSKDSAHPVTVTCLRQGIRYPY